MRHRADWTKLIERRALAQPDAIAEIAERKISTAILSGEAGAAKGMGRVEPSRANAIKRGAPASPVDIANEALLKLGAVPRGTKYGNRSVIVDGYRFDSRLEADRYQELKLLKASGAVRWFIRQVPFSLAPGRVTYRADFLVVWANPYEMAEHAGEGLHPPVSVEECKGYLTETARVKLALVRDRYGFDVRVLKRADVQRFT